MKISKKVLIILLSLVIVIVGAVAVLLVAKKPSIVEGGQTNQINQIKEKTEEEVINLAREWVVSNSPTYKFDGSGLNVQQVEKLTDLNYKIVFAFSSSAAGYGNRDGETNTQVITSHSIVVVSDNGIVQSAITDEKYDEVNKKLIENN